MQHHESAAVWAAVRLGGRNLVVEDLLHGFLVRWRDTPLLILVTEAGVAKAGAGVRDWRLKGLLHPWRQRG